MLFIALIASVHAQEVRTNEPTPSIADAQHLASTCTGPRECDFDCWGAAVRLLEPTDQGGTRIACYTEGESHGPIVSWHPNGRKEGVGYTHMGVPVGGYVAWHNNGRAAATGMWHGGELHGLLTTWHDNGQVQSRGEWRNGVQSGVVRHWHNNGQLDEVGHWKNRKPEGPLYSWYSDGKRKAQARYADGKPHGLWKQWYPNGKREVFARYRHGTIQFIRCWEASGKQSICPSVNESSATSSNHEASNVNP